MREGFGPLVSRPMQVKGVLNLTTLAAHSVVNCPVAPLWVRGFSRGDLLGTHGPKGELMAHEWESRRQSRAYGSGLCAWSIGRYSSMSVRGRGQFPALTYQTVRCVINCRPSGSVR